MTTALIREDGKEKMIVNAARQQCSSTVLVNALLRLEFSDEVLEFSFNPNSYFESTSKVSQVFILFLLCIDYLSMMY